MGARPHLRVADVFRSGWKAYRGAHRVGHRLAQVVRHIQVCRTAALGGRLHRCDTCHAEVPLYKTYTYADFYGSQAGGSWWDLTSILPYTGTVNGPGPLIPARPDSATLDTTLLGTARDDVRIDCRLWRLRGELGVTLSKDVTKRLSAYVSPQFALEYVDMRATRIETLSYTDARTQETVMLASDTQNRRRAMFIPGFLLTGGLDYLLSEHWYAGASVGWEWLARDPSIRIGPNKIRYHLDGGEFSLYVGRYF